MIPASPDIPIRALPVEPSLETLWRLLCRADVEREVCAAMGDVSGAFAASAKVKRLDEMIREMTDGERNG